MHFERLLYGLSSFKQFQFQHIDPVEKVKRTEVMSGMLKTARTYATIFAAIGGFTYGEIPCTLSKVFFISSLASAGFFHLFGTYLVDVELQKMIKARDHK